MGGAPATPTHPSSAVDPEGRGQKYRTVDWSLGGRRIQAAGGQFQLKQRLAGRVRLAGTEGRGDFVAEVVRIESDGQVALRWVEMSPQIFVAMGQ